MSGTTDLEERVEAIENEVGIEPGPSLVERVEEAVASENVVEECQHHENLVKTHYQGNADLTQNEVEYLRADGLEISYVAPAAVYIMEAE